MTVTLTPPVTTADRRAVPQPPGRFRPDIDGLRAVAILLVVAYHADVPGMRAGFIGVDVFFVISGFLITSVLVDEMDRFGTVRLRRFWARRARRLLPAASVVTVFTLLAGMVVRTPLDWATMARQGLASTTYLSNVLFGLGASDYFGESAQSSPFLHTWSLSVEEQFYLVWPVLLLAGLVVARRAGAETRRFLLLVLAIVTGVSFALSLTLTDQRSPWAFFSSASRAWELGAGALLAVGLPARAPRRPKLRAKLAFAGLALLAAALLTIDGGTPFPGRAALLPVLGTMALIAAGAAGSGVGRLLAARPLQALGRLSYSWYLWHWPVLVLGMDQLGANGLGTRITLALASLVPAVLTYRFVENPIRHSPALAASNRRTFGVVALMMAGALGVGLLTNVRATHALRDPRLHVLAVARVDRPPLPLGCATTNLQDLEEHCASGDPNGRATILVIGDSHAAQWVPAIDRAAWQLGARVISSVQGNCPSLGVAWSGELPSCGLRRGLLPALVEELRPQLVVVSHSVGYVGGLATRSGGMVDRDRQLDAWTDSLAQLASRLHTSGTPLAVILDTPRHGDDPIECLAREWDTGRCGVSLAETLRTVGPVHDAEREALRRAGHGTAFDPLPHLCADKCPSAPGGAVAYVDTHHLTASYSASLADELLPVLEAELSKESSSARSGESKHTMPADVGPS